ncbi:addiction module protein [Luteolibacter flavescens]|uniref:addiction module protein n=1 Tax=Luteolibacter flavescens TaxID=1859460 RepID=UPI003CCCA184
MSIADIPFEEFTKADKIALMEKLWDELSEDGPPAWHADVLASRAEEWERRDEVSEDWDTARAKLGSRGK